MIRVHQRHGETDERTTYDSITAPWRASRGKNDNTLCIAMQYLVYAELMLHSKLTIIALLWSLYSKFHRGITATGRLLKLDALTQKQIRQESMQLSMHVALQMEATATRHWDNAASDEDWTWGNWRSADSLSTRSIAGLTDGEKSTAKGHSETPAMQNYQVNSVVRYRGG